MEDSPVKEKRRKEKKQRRKNCTIHIDSQTDDNKLSAFSEQSWKIIMQCVRRSESYIFILCLVHATAFCV